MLSAPAVKIGLKIVFVGTADSLRYNDSQGQIRLLLEFLVIDAATYCLQLGFYICVTFEGRLTSGKGGL